MATSGNIFFDTNIYLRVFYSAEYARHHQQRFARLAPHTYLCSVVAGELYAGAHTLQTARLVDGLLAPYVRVQRLVFPNHNDWVDMGKVTASILQARPAYRSKLSALQNDILIALSAKRIGATVVSENVKDFTLLQQFVSFCLLAMPSTS